MPKEITELKVFLASPSDVSAERARARQILTMVNDAVGEARGIHLKAIGWEDVSSELGDPQELINSYSVNADLVIVLFNRRFGTPTASSASGTIEEFMRAKESWQLSGTPRVMLFFKDVDQASVDDPGKQLEQIIRFRRAFENDRTGLFQTFSDVEDFAYKFHRSLLRWLEKRPAPALRRAAPKMVKAGTLGPVAEVPETLESRIAQIRQEAHRVFSPGPPVFFSPFLVGHEKDLDRIAKALHTQGKSIILHGPPASGKTSLLKMLEKREHAPYCSACRGYTWTIIIRTIIEKVESEVSIKKVFNLRRKPALLTPDEAAERLHQLPKLVIVDDFDKVEVEERRHFAELIKKLSNRQAHLTLLLAGRATTIGELIPDYVEIEPYVTEVKALPLSPADHERIIDLGFSELGITIETAARDYILSQSSGNARVVHQYCLDCVYALELRIRQGDKRELTIGLKECELAEADRPTVGYPTLG